MAEKPRFHYVNSITSGAVVFSVHDNSTVEIEHPATFLLSLWAIKRIRSCHESYIVTTKGNKINFNIGGGALTATVPDGQYRIENLLGELEDLMNVAASVTDITVEYNVATQLVTFAKGAGTFQLLSASGANKDVSLYPALGFNLSTDKTGSLSYVGTYATTGSFGRYVITSANNKLYFNIGGGGLTATITAATYNLKNLMAEIKKQMDTASGGTSNNVYFEESTHLWHFSRPSGTFQLDFGTTTNTIAPTLGFTNTNKTGALDYAAQAVSIHTSERYVIALPGAAQDNVHALIGHNFTTDVTAKHEANATNSWPGSYSHTYLYDANIMFKFPASPSSTNHAFRSVEISDPTNPDGFIEFGVVTGGDYFALSRFMHRKTPEESAISLSVPVMGDFGNVGGGRKGKLDTLAYRFPWINEADRVNLKAMFESVELSAPILFFEDVETTPPYAKVFWVRLANRPKLNPVTGVASQAIYVIDIDFVEAK